jgi:hypothetical protein
MDKIFCLLRAFAWMIFAFYNAYELKDVGNNYVFFFFLLFVFSQVIFAFLEFEKFIN